MSDSGINILDHSDTDTIECETAGWSDIASNSTDSTRVTLFAQFLARGRHQCRVEWRAVLNKMTVCLVGVLCMLCLVAVVLQFFLCWGENVLL